MPGENFPGDRIVSLVDELEGLIEEAKPPFGKNAQFKVIDADVFFNILDEIRMSYPEEWQKSRRILKEREELMASCHNLGKSHFPYFPQKANVRA